MFYRLWANEIFPIIVPMEFTCWFRAGEIYVVSSITSVGHDPAALNDPLFFSKNAYFNMQTMITFQASYILIFIHVCGSIVCSNRFCVTWTECINSRTMQEVVLLVFAWKNNVFIMAGNDKKWKKIVLTKFILLINDVVKV